MNRIAKRIIPARAGFTRRAHHLPRPGPDHPRSRGVYDKPLTTDISQVGSSPLARGLRANISPSLFEAGIIPARAGFTNDFGGECFECGDHPRSRGVYVRTGAIAGLAGGSSPLARGLLKIRPKKDGL